MRFAMAVVWFAAAVSVPFAVSGAEPAPTKTPEALKSAARTPTTPGQPAQSRAYIHPIRKFVLAIPPDAEVAERGEAVQVSIRSRTGYMINVQTGDSSPGVPLPAMLAKLETSYLGQGRPWSRKLGSGALQVAGLEAIEAVYEGAGTRVKVVVARGRKTDFVFMFFAPTDAFEDFQTKFDWWLANFEPDAGERAAMRAQPVAPMAPTGRAQPGPKRFAEDRFGYSIQYPPDWELAIPSDAVTAFSGKAGSDAFHAVVSIQNVRPANAATPDQAAAAAMADLKASLTSEAEGLSIIGEQPLTYRNGALTLTGRQMVATYTYGGQRYRKWALVVPRPNGTVTHIWSYTAPESRFDAYRPMADAMLRSWTIRAEGG